MWPNPQETGDRNPSWETSFFMECWKFVRKFKLKENLGVKAVSFDC